MTASVPGVLLLTSLHLRERDREIERERERERGRERERDGRARHTDGTVKRTRVHPEGPSSPPPSKATGAYKASKAGVLPRRSESSTRQESSRRKDV